MDDVAQKTDREKVGTQQKALALNLDKNRYGTFAEIGAGQEVVRWFFQAGAAAGTIAKSISAYDMTVSDAIYGKSPRYVSRQRLQTMLEYEYDLLTERLAEGRDDPQFFAFANTVRARIYHGNDECHGWMGIRYQATPGGEPSQILTHVRMLDRENQAQQEALGILGVNLIYGAYEYFSNTDDLLKCLLDDLSTERIEVDMIKLSGPAFEEVDQRLVSLKLVQLGLSRAAMFSTDGSVLHAAEVLYKKPILVERGRFRPVTYVNMDILNSARQQFARRLDEEQQEGVVPIMELTLQDLRTDGELNHRDFLDRVDVLEATDTIVLVSNYFEYFRLAAYLRRYSQMPIALAIGLPSLKDLFDESIYEELDGGILEAFGRLFKGDLKLYVYPTKNQETGELATTKDLEVAPHLKKLYAYLCDNDFIEQIDCYTEDYLHIYSDDVLRKIHEQDASWDEMVPPEVGQLIKERGLFGYKGEG